MRKLVFFSLLLGLSVSSVAQQTTQPNQNSRQEGVVQRGDHVMGFSHDTTTHHFHLLKGGGEIVVTANDANDKASIDQIRTHLDHIVRMFSNGNFNTHVRSLGTFYAAIARRHPDSRWSAGQVRLS